MKQLEQLKQQALNDNIPIITEDGLSFIDQLIKKQGINTMLEIGSAVGYSSIALATFNPTLKVLTLEKDEQRYQQAVANIAAFHLDQQIQIVHTDAYDFNCNQPFDLIFIDGAKAQTMGFLNHFIGNLRLNGYIVVDNISFHGFVSQWPNIKNRGTRQLVGKIIKFIEQIKTDQRFEASILPTIGDGIALLHYIRKE